MEDRNWKYKWIWAKRTKSKAKVRHVCFQKAEVVFPVEAMKIWAKEKDGLQKWPQKLNIEASSRITDYPGMIEIVPFLPKQRKKYDNRAKANSRLG